jgi:hypothetical protein
MQRVEDVFAHWSGLFDSQHHSKLVRSTHSSRSAGFSCLLSSSFNFPVQTARAPRMPGRSEVVAIS